MEAGEEWERDNPPERIRIEQVWQREQDSPDRLTVRAKVLQGPRAFFSPVGPDEFLASVEWIEGRYTRCRP